MSAMYAIYHGSSGLRHIGERVHNATLLLHKAIQDEGHNIKTQLFFDTMKVLPKGGVAKVMERAWHTEINLRYFEDGHVSPAHNLVTLNSKKK